METTFAHSVKKGITMSENQVNVNQDERIWMIGVHLSLFFGVVFEILLPYSYTSIVLLYALPIVVLVVALTRSEHNEIAALTQAIVSTQSVEIAQMRQMLLSL
jgi:hypothetical protein